MVCGMAAVSCSFSVGINYPRVIYSRRQAGLGNWLIFCDFPALFRRNTGVFTPFPAIHNFISFYFWMLLTLFGNKVVESRETAYNRVVMRPYDAGNRRKNARKFYFLSYLTLHSGPYRWGSRWHYAIKSLSDKALGCCTISKNFLRFSCCFLRHKAS